MTTITELKKLLFSMILKTPIWLVHLAANQSSVMSIPNNSSKERSFEDHSNAPLIFVLVQILTKLSHF